MRRLVDTKTRLDHGESQVNIKHGDDDTTTPRSMHGGHAQAAARRCVDHCVAAAFDWLVRTQPDRCADLARGLPPQWRIGDKTGSGHDASNDVNVAVVWRSRRKPLLIASCDETDGHDVATPVS